ncbi:uncharacterized protein [Miscanthus floridulus]|uniref:uncharacterized protein n=1 Tax=Miscanthus floridulus TaxID=154761 RepID=UPI00345AF6B3
MTIQVSVSPKRPKPYLRPLPPPSSRHYHQQRAASRLHTPHGRPRHHRHGRARLHRQRASSRGAFPATAAVLAVAAAYPSAAAAVLAVAAAVPGAAAIVRAAILLRARRCRCTRLSRRSRRPHPRRRSRRPLYRRPRARIQERPRASAPRVVGHFGKTFERALGSSSTCLNRAESSRSVRGLRKGVSGKPYPHLCNARRPRLEPGTFRSQTAAVAEGIDIDDGSTILRLASKVDAIIESLENDKQKVGIEISRGSELSA